MKVTEVWTQIPTKCSESLRIRQNKEKKMYKRNWLESEPLFIFKIMYYNFISPHYNTVPLFWDHEIQ